MPRQAIIEELENKLIGVTMSTISGGVTYQGEVRSVFYHPSQKCYKAKCKFYNEESYFTKTITTEGEVVCM